MITPALTRIMIVPDFGTENDEGLMKALKDAVMKSGENCAMVTDLRKMMPEGLPDGEPAESKIWPWKKQYYAGRKTAGNRYAGFPVRKEAIETAYSFGTVSSVRHEQPRRFAIFTDREKAHDDDDFSERYPRRSMTDASLSGDVSGLAEVIGSFSKGKMDTPLLEIDTILSDFPKMAMGNTICTFDEPVRLGSLTALGLISRIPMANGLSGIRVRIDRLSPSSRASGAFRHGHVSSENRA